MTDAPAYAVFGTHPLFGDYVDAIHGCGGRLRRLVRNVAEPPRPAGCRVEDRIARYENWLRGNGVMHRVQTVWLADYAPASGEQCVAGFRGPKLQPLVDDLRTRFGLVFASLVHPTAYVSPMACLGEGVFVGAQSVIGPHARIGDFAFVNRGVTLGHDTRVEPHVIVGPSAAIASGVCLAFGCVIGLGARVIENRTVGRESYVGAGAVVIRDVAPHRLVVGVPAEDKRAFFRAP